MLTRQNSRMSSGSGGSDGSNGIVIIIARPVSFHSVHLEGNEERKKSVEKKNLLSWNVSQETGDNLQTKPGDGDNPRMQRGREGEKERDLRQIAETGVKKKFACGALFKTLVYIPHCHWHWQ
jgi:hypothetical protein